MQCEFNVMEQLDMFVWHAWAQFLMIQLVNDCKPNVGLMPL